MIIETERLLLRPFTEGDAKDLYEYLHSPTQSCFFCMRLDTMEDALNGALERAGDEHYLAIVLKDTGKVIGEIFGGPECTDPTSNARDTWSPCWMLNPAFKGRGYGFEAARAYIDHLFTALGARRVHMYTEDTNIPCQRLCEKLGARKEGLFMEFVSFYDDENGNPVYENTMQYAILRKEWKGGAFK